MLAGPRGAGLVAGSVMLAVYVATLAPGVTFWDAGEFIAAARVLGIPHPPGTPLYILLLRAWTLVLAGLGTALAANLFSAICTAVAAGACAALLARVSGSRAAGIGAGLCAGAMSSVWLNATETEVYAVSLLLAWLALLAGERAGRGGERHWLVLTAYLFGLAAALHVSALVAAPAAIALAAMPSDAAGERWWRRLRVPDAACLATAFVLAAAIGTGHEYTPVAAAAALLVAGAIGVARPRLARWRVALPMLGVTLLAASLLSVLLLRAQHDPAINQGNPATLDALLEVVSRSQYQVPGLWPRRAPLWMQLANVVQYADWQVALGLAPGAAFEGRSVLRMLCTMAYVALGIAGATAHRRLDPRTWRGFVVLFLCATLGVALYLNLRAGPSIGVGILPDDATHEPRERDYFFALGFWTWGLWAGLGAVGLVRRRVSRTRLATAAGLAVAALPIALNWTAVTRRAEPEASLPKLSALALLRSAPERAVLFVYGDNDTYPVWYLQQAEGVRRDVTVVTIPLLPARWYRQELERREGLVAGPDGWEGLQRTLMRLSRSARDAGRPVAVSVGVIAGERRGLGDRWVLSGVLYEAMPGPPGTVVDTARAGALASWLERQTGDREPRRGTDPTPRIAAALLRCPGLARRAGPSGEAGDTALLDSICNRR